MHLSYRESGTLVLAGAPVHPPSLAFELDSQSKRMLLPASLVLSSYNKQLLGDPQHAGGSTGARLGLQGRGSVLAASHPSSVLPSSLKPSLSPGWFQHSDLC